jgi:hypothetical protein
VHRAQVNDLWLLRWTCRCRSWVVWKPPNLFAHMRCIKV